METFEVIPALDLLAGRCVRLTRGDYRRKTVYRRDPVEQAGLFLEAGLEWLHVVDLDGARSGRPVNLDIVAAIAATGIRVQLGGGLRRKEHLEQAFDSGVEIAVIGSLLVSAGEDRLREWAADFPGRLAAGIDARHGRVAVHGWRSTTSVRAVALGKQVAGYGFSRVIYTDISRDGTLSGPNLKGLKVLAANTSLPVFAAGGIGGIDDLRRVRECEPWGVRGVIVGKAIYDGRISLEELRQC
jgi:phosphoribosylformimino-5-aminoimidazole carboxamide ribotide isomerase